MEAILCAREVTVVLEGVTVLERVSLEVASGASLAVVGGSNSGKSTLLRVLAGLLTPTRGAVLLKGTAARSRDRLGIPWREGIGYVSQRLGLRSNMTAVENVMLALRYHGRMADEAARRRAEWLLRRLGVRELSVRPAALAPGEAELVALARAVAHEPSVLLFDNPTVVLDVDVAGRVLDLLHELRKAGLAVVSATASDAVASVIAESVRRLRDGRMEEP